MVLVFSQVFGGDALALVGNGGLCSVVFVFSQVFGCDGGVLIGVFTSSGSMPITLSCVGAIIVLALISFSSVRFLRWTFEKLFSFDLLPLIENIKEGRASFLWRRVYSGVQYVWTPIMLQCDRIGDGGSCDVMG